MSEEQDPADEAGDATADYETATARLDEIIARLDSGDAQLRETLDLCAEAKDLIEYCATELAAVDEGLKELRLEDLAASLDPRDQVSQSTGSEPPRPGEPPPMDEPPPTDEPPPPPEEPPF
jgi:exodeoxyribonuclease VII small subunit